MNGQFVDSLIKMGIAPGISKDVGFLFAPGLHTNNLEQLIRCISRFALIAAVG